MNAIAYIKEKGLRRALSVMWQYKLPRLQVKLVSLLTRTRRLDRKILIESHNDFDCNGGALYRYLVDCGYNDHLEIVWLLRYPASRELPEHVACVPLYGPSWRKAWHICTATWLTSDCVVTEKVRSDQISLYMTHGIFGLKNFKGLGDLPETIDYVLSPSPAMDDVFRDMRSITSPGTRLVHLGYPVLDRLYGGRHSDGYRGVFGGKRSGGPTFLWMPTFRKDTACERNDAEGAYPYGTPLINDERGLERLAWCLNDCDARLMIKLHPKQDLSAISGRALDGIEFITGNSIKTLGCDTYDLMLDADALITDYSGAVFEYLALDRPVAFVTADIDRYKLGLVEHAERYMPGPKITTLAELETFIRDVCAGVDAYACERADFCRWFYAHHDDLSCERVTRYLGIA